MPQNIPYGNAYIANTPKMDSLQAMMANDQRQKALQEQRNAQLLDQEFAKNTSAMRDVDIPLLTKKWGEYKQKKQELYRYGNKMSNDERIQKELDAQRTLGEGYSIMGKSKELKAPEDEYQKAYMKDPFKLDENTPAILVQSRNTPIDLHPGFETLANEVQLKTKDFSPVVALAMGKKNKIANSVEVSPDKLTTTPTDYYAYNSPSQFAANVMEKLPTQRERNMFVNQHSYSDLAAQDILQKYAAIKGTPAFQKAYPNEPDYTAEDLSDPFKKSVALLSMEHIIRNPPTAIVGKPYNNTSEMMNAKNAEWDRRNSKTYQQALHKQGISIAAHRANAELLAKSGIVVKDPMETLDGANPIKIPQSEFDPSVIGLFRNKKALDFIPFKKGTSEDNIKYIAGKKTMDGYGPREIPTVNYNGLEGFYRDENGVYYDENGQEVPKDRGLINFIQDKSASLTKVNKGTVQVEGKTDSNTGGVKTKGKTGKTIIIPQ